MGVSTWLGPTSNAHFDRERVFDRNRSSPRAFSAPSPRSRKEMQSLRNIEELLLVQKVQSLHTSVSSSSLTRQDLHATWRQVAVTVENGGWGYRDVAADVCQGKCYMINYTAAYFSHHCPFLSATCTLTQVPLYISFFFYFMKVHLKKQGVMNEQQ